MNRRFAFVSFTAAFIVGCTEVPSLRPSATTSASAPAAATRVMPVAAMTRATPVAKRLSKAERIEQIAAFLPAEPAAPGARITDRKAWNRLAALPEASRIITKAGQIVAVPVPECPDELYLDFTRNGNRTRYQKVYQRRISNLNTLLTAECLENKGRFLSKIADYVSAICDERSWTLPAHDPNLTNFNRTLLFIDLGSSARALALATTCDWLRGRLPDALMKRVSDEINRRVFQPYLETSRNPSPANRKRLSHWWYYAEMNWNSVCNSCTVRAALAIIRDRRLRAEFIESAERTVPYALKGYTDDGYCSEGMGYWNYGYGHHLVLGLAVREATGGKINLLADPKNHTVMQYAYGYQIQHGQSPHFADGGGNPAPVFLALGRQMWPDLVCSEAVTLGLLTGSPDQYALRAFGQDPGPKVAGPTLDTLPIRTWFPDAQVLISRNDPTRTDLALGIAVKGGHNNELHNHNDVGSYALMMDSVDMTGDPGGEIYTRRTFSKDRYVSNVLNSYGHPVPVINGKLQKVGRAFAAKILKTEFTPMRDTIVIDITSAYGLPDLKSLVRTVTHDRKTDRITISDTFAYARPMTFEVPVITYQKVVKGADPSVLTLHKPKGRRTLQLKIDTHGAPWTLSEEEIQNPGRPSPRRLGIKLNKPVLSGTVSTSFTAL